MRPGPAGHVPRGRLPHRHFVGDVEQVRLQPAVVQNVVTYSTVIAVPNPDLKLKPGMTANVNIEIARRNNVLRIPNAATRFRPTHRDVPGAQPGGAARARARPRGHGPRRRGEGMRGGNQPGGPGGPGRRRRRRARRQPVPQARPAGAPPAAAQASPRRQRPQASAHGGAAPARAAQRRRGSQDGGAQASSGPEAAVRAVSVRAAAAARVVKDSAVAAAAAAASIRT